MDQVPNGHRVVSWRPSKRVAGAHDGECSMCGERVVRSRTGVVFGLTMPCRGNDWHRPAASSHPTDYFRGD